MIHLSRLTTHRKEIAHQVVHVKLAFSAIDLGAFMVRKRKYVGVNFLPDSFWTSYYPIRDIRTIQTLRDSSPYLLEPPRLIRIHEVLMFHQ
jgi:hypothetical protein